MALGLLIAHGLLLIPSSAFNLRGPDFISEWYSMGNGSVSTEHVFVNISHGFQELPAIVDVQIKSDEEPNPGFIFPGLPTVPIDEEGVTAYGGVVYFYSDEGVYLVAPSPHSNKLDKTLSVISTGVLARYWTTANAQRSPSAQVRVRLWKESSLPTPDFQRSGILVEAKKNIFMEIKHGLKLYPGHVRVRARMHSGHVLLNGSYFDAQGSNAASSTAYLNHGHVYWSGLLYGYNDDMIRIWAPNGLQSFMFLGADGWGLDDDRSLKTEVVSLEISVWRPSVTLTQKWEYLGPTTKERLLEVTLPRKISIENDLLRVQLKCIDGDNQGFIFRPLPAPFTFMNSDPGEFNYGGLMYAYNGTKMRLWKPTASNGYFVLIHELMGKLARPVLQRSEEVLMELAILTNDISCLTDSLCQGTDNSSSSTFEKRLEEMRIDTRNTSAKRRSKTSASDYRTSAQSIGSVGVAILVVMFGLLCVIDCSRLFRSVKRRSKTS